MPKIKNWEKDDETKWEISYRNRENRNIFVLIVFSESHLDGDIWKVEILKHVNDDNILYKNKNKAKAKKFAVEWMREHPYG